jgi:hypothetical protein
MALMLHWRPVNRQVPLFQQEARHGWFLFNLAVRTFEGALGGWEICLSVGLLCP